MGDLVNGKRLFPFVFFLSFKLNLISALLKNLNTFSWLLPHLLTLLSLPSLIQLISHLLTGLLLQKPLSIPLLCLILFLHLLLHSAHYVPHHEVPCNVLAPLREVAGMEGVIGVHVPFHCPIWLK